MIIQKFLDFTCIWNKNVMFFWKWCELYELWIEGHFQNCELQSKMSYGNWKLECELQPSISLTHFWLEFTVHSSQMANCELFVREHQSLHFSIWNKNIMFFWKWRELKLKPLISFSFLTEVHSSQFTTGKFWTLCQRAPKLAILNLK